MRVFFLGQEGRVKADPGGVNGVREFPSTSLLLRKPPTSTSKRSLLQKKALEKFS